MKTKDKILVAIPAIILGTLTLYLVGGLILDEPLVLAPIIGVGYIFYRNK